MVEPVALCDRLEQLGQAAEGRIAVRRDAEVGGGGAHGLERVRRRGQIRVAASQVDEARPRLGGRGERRADDAHEELLGQPAEQGRLVPRHAYLLAVRVSGPAQSGRPSAPTGSTRSVVDVTWTRPYA